MTISYSIRSTVEFDEWLSSLSPKLDAIVRIRLSHIEQNGHFGPTRSLGDGLFELKWKNGLRVYFIRTGKTEVTVLLGGLKNGQEKDIKKAKRLF